MKKTLLLIGKYFYHNYFYLTITWSILMFLMFLKINYTICLEKLNFTNSINNIYLVFIILFTIIGSFFLYFSHNIRKNKKQIIDKDNSNFVGRIRNHDDIKIVILPIFYIWIFALSKIIITIYKLNTTPNNDISFYTLMVWLGFFIATLYYWCIFKYKANEKQRYNIGYTIFIVLYTLSILYWDILVPYIKNIFLLKNCIMNTIMAS